MAFTAQPAAAQFNILSVVSPDCRTCGACSICDLMSVLTKTMRFLLSLSGALALAMFIWGGLSLLLSGGNAEAVQQGKKVISGTVVGLTIILLLAWVWPNWIILALKGAPITSTPLSIFGSDGWWLTPCASKNVTQTCTKPPSYTTAPIAGECVQDKNNYKPAGTPCTNCGVREAACVCDTFGSCVAGCRVNLDCYGRRTSYNLNYCDKKVTGKKEIGMCASVAPGSACTSNADCPPYLILKEAFPVTLLGYPPFIIYAPSTNFVPAEMECVNMTNPTKSVCRIKGGQPCERHDQCQQPDFTCVWKCTPRKRVRGESCSSCGVNPLCQSSDTCDDPQCESGKCNCTGVGGLPPNTCT